MSADSFAKISKDVSEVSVEQVGQFVKVAEANALKSAFTEESASNLLGSLTNSVNLPSVDFGSVSKLASSVTKMGDGTALVKDIATGPREVMEQAKDSIFGGASSLKTAFNTLPRSVQAAIVGDTGALNSTKSYKLPGYNATSSYANFFNKITSGSYVLTPGSFKRDVNNLSAFTKSAVKNGIFSSVTNLAGMLGGKPGTLSGILTRVAVGTVLAKNSKAILKMGVNIGAGSNSMSVPAGKSAMVKTIFTDMKLPTIKSSEINGVHNEMILTAKVFDRNADVPTTGVATASAFVDGSSTVRKVFDGKLRNTSLGTDAGAMSAINITPDILRDITVVGAKKQISMPAFKGSAFA